MPKTEAKRKRGRPKGTTDYEEPKINKVHRLTPKAHEWIKAHKEEIEIKARQSNPQ